ncbi:M24 family metallopeptidase [Bacillus horti]|uniref:Xaa-Pro aminopeptidase n=1 Tax=Caldalkalibacillus horti TaxID=77523 RepID=A0ABT9W216_9BACI|nr:Xaa-Pro peptidase family protein [Bacillus horti]MDQ0166890.1 Xaa-Pro aminopeptidase [Bacillus horti]
MEQRINRLRALFDEHQVDGFLITSKSNRRYMTGFTGSAGVVLITKTEAVFITDFRYEEQAKEQAQGFEIVKHVEPIGEKIAEVLERLNVKRLAFEQDHVTFATYRGYQQRFSAELVPVSGAVEKLRMIKDEQEIQTIRHAVKIADETFTHILNFIKPGLTEIQVANELEFHMRSLGASTSSFDMIVASGARSALPHGVASDKVIEKGDFVTLDFGAVYQGYISDMTRTFAVGQPSDKLIEIYNICLEAQLQGVRNIKAGITGKQADDYCRDYITAKGYGEQFGHSTGHGIGLDVHEDPKLSKKGSDELLQPGMVVTVEPGIYLAGVGGVRIEDNIVIKETGNEILTQSTKELIIID